MIPPVISASDLRRRRLKLHLSQRKLAQRLGVQQNTVWRWEAGVHTLPLFLGDALSWYEHVASRRVDAPR